MYIEDLHMLYFMHTQYWVKATLTINFSNQDDFFHKGSSTNEENEEATTLDSKSQGIIRQYL